MRLPPPRVVAVDVDGTLLTHGIPNLELISWLRRKKSEGFELMLWSQRGKHYAAHACSHCGLDGLFDVICSKPGYLVDDRGWSWILETEVVTSLIDMTGKA